MSQRVKFSVSENTNAPAIELSWEIGSNPQEWKNLRGLSPEDLNHKVAQSVKIDMQRSLRGAFKDAREAGAVSESALRAFLQKRVDEWKYGATRRGGTRVVEVADLSMIPEALGVKTIDQIVANERAGLNRQVKLPAWYVEKTKK